MSDSEEGVLITAQNEAAFWKRHADWLTDKLIRAEDQRDEARELALEIYGHLGCDCFKRRWDRLPDWFKRGKAK